MCLLSPTRASDPLPGASPTLYAQQESSGRAVALEQGQCDLGGLRDGFAGLCAHRTSGFAGLLMDKLWMFLLAPPWVEVLSSCFQLVSKRSKLAFCSS